MSQSDNKLNLKVETASKVKQTKCSLDYKKNVMLYIYLFFVALKAWPLPLIVTMLRNRRQMDGVFKTFVEYLKIPSKKFIYTYIIVHKKKKVSIALKIIPESVFAMLYYSRSDWWRLLLSQMKLFNTCFQQNFRMSFFLQYKVTVLKSMVKKLE